MKYKHKKFTAYYRKEKKIIIEVRIYLEDNQDTT